MSALTKATCLMTLVAVLYASPLLYTVLRNGLPERLHLLALSLLTVAALTVLFYRLLARFFSTLNRRGWILGAITFLLIHISFGLIVASTLVMFSLGAGAVYIIGLTIIAILFSGWQVALVGAASG